MAGESGGGRIGGGRIGHLHRQRRRQAHRAGAAARQSPRPHRRRHRHGQDGDAPGHRRGPVGGGRPQLRRRRQGRPVGPRDGGLADGQAPRDLRRARRRDRRRRLVLCRQSGAILGPVRRSDSPIAVVGDGFASPALFGGILLFVALVALFYRRTRAAVTSAGGAGRRRDYISASSDLIGTKAKATELSATP